MPFFTQVAASGAPAAAYRGFSTQSAATIAPAAASRCLSAPAAASRCFSSKASAPSAASRCLSAPAAASSALEPVGVGGYGGGGRSFRRRLGYGALATFAGLVIMTSCAPVTEWDLVHEELQADYAEADERYDELYESRRTYMHLVNPSRRPPSAREVRQNTEMLKIVHRRLKEVLKKKQKDQSIDIEKKKPDWFWDGLDDLIKKWKPYLSAADLVKSTFALMVATVTGIAYLHEKFGDPVCYFECPYSGHTEVAFMFLFSVKPNDEKQGDGPSGGRQIIFSSTRTNSDGLEGMGINNIMEAFCCQKEPESTILRPFNWIGIRMDFIPGVNGPSEGVPRVFASFINNLLHREPLQHVDGGKSQRTSVYIKDAVEAGVMIENPARANGHIFNVGNPNNEVAVMEIAVMMTEVYTNVSGEPPLEESVIDVCAQQFYGEGYEDRDNRTPDMALINKQLGWNPMTSLKGLLETTLTYLHTTYKEAVKTQMSQALASC